MNGFDIFYTDQARARIHNLTKRYREGICDGRESAIAAGFVHCEKILLNKLALAIQAENVDIGSLQSGLIQNVMIKPVSDACNLACTYCYEGKGSARYGANFMQIKTLEKIISEALNICGNDLVFLWHGGEPTLAGLLFFQSAIALQLRYNTRNIKIRNVIQTNGVDLDEHLLDFFIEKDFRIGISLDGPEAINDFHRIDHKQNGTYQAVIKTFRLLHARQVPFGVITVLNYVHKAQAGAYYRFLVNEGVKYVDVHPSFGQSYILPPNEFSDFVIELFDEWLGNEGAKIRVNIFDEIFQLMYGEKPSTCYHAGTCSKIFAIEANGNMVPCTRPFDRTAYTFGNVTESALTEIIEGRKYVGFAEDDRLSQANSGHCPWHSICHNGCPQHRLTDGKQDIKGASIYCQCQSGIPGGNFAIWDHITKRTKEILHLNELLAESSL